MSKHILDRARRLRTARARRLYLTLERSDRQGGLSRLVSKLDRARKVRKSRTVPAFLAIERRRVT